LKAIKLPRKRKEEFKKSQIVKKCFEKYKITEKENQKKIKIQQTGLERGNKFCNHHHNFFFQSQSDVRGGPGRSEGGPSLGHGVRRELRADPGLLGRLAR